MKRGALQRPLNRLQESLQASLPAPIGGWNSRDPLAQLAPTDCVQLTNWIVRPQVVQTRLGSTDHLTGLPANAVETLLDYNFAPTPKLFAAVGTAFYDATVAGAAGATVVSGLTNARWQHVNYSNSAGNYLVTVNGADDMRTWNGTVWATTASFSGTAVNTNTLIGVAVYRERLFFVENNLLSFYYLAAGAISGAGARFQLGQICNRGGYTMAVANWTIDAGDGADDHLVAITSEGEAVVYKGTDPSSSTTWTLVGVYYVGRPLGRRCLFKFGGDLLLLTDRGLVPLSKALQSASVDKTVALTDKISQTFNEKGSSLFSAFGWQAQLHTRESFLLVNVPDTPKTQYIMDLNTGSWSAFTGWSASCWAYFQGDLYYGTTSTVVKAYTGTSDNGSAILCQMLTGYDYFGERGLQKKVTLLRPNFAATGAFSYALGLLGDFERNIPSVTLTTTPSTTSVWDTGLWDVAVWSSDYILTQDWQTAINTPSFNFGLTLQLSTAAVTVQLLSVDYVYLRGSIK